MKKKGFEKILEALQANICVVMQFFFSTEVEQILLQLLVFDYIRQRFKCGNLVCIVSLILQCQLFTV